MNEELIKKYKNEMMRMYINSQNFTTADLKTPEISPTPTNDLPLHTQNGKLLGVVTSFNSLYPVENAKVTVFLGEYEDMQIIDTDKTDQNGKTKLFILPTENKNLSLAPDLSQKPYSVYNMAVEADGFLTNIHINIPIFSGITSIQKSDLILDSDQTGNEPQIFDEGQKYNL